VLLSAIRLTPPETPGLARCLVPGLTPAHAEFEAHYEDRTDRVLQHRTVYVLLTTSYLGIDRTLTMSVKIIVKRERAQAGLAAARARGRFGGEEQNWTNIRCVK